MRSRTALLGLVGVLAVVVFALLVRPILSSPGATREPIVEREASSTPLLSKAAPLKKTPAPTTASPPVRITPLAIPSPSPTATPTGREGILIFNWVRERNQDLYAIDLAASSRGPLSQENAPIRLTDHPGPDRSPAWSPDGARIAFASRRERNWDLYLLDVATGAVSRLTDDPHYDGAPTWSPDGEYIAFESMREGDLDVFTLRLSDGTIAPVTTDATPDYGPAWSPDGQHIAFVAWRDGNREIYLASPTGVHAPYNFTTNPADDHHPTWLESGGLSFVSDRDGRSALYVQTTEQPGTIGIPSIVHTLAGTRYLGVTDHSWSPDGESVASVQSGRRTSSLVVSSVTSNRQRTPLLYADGAIGDPDWFAGEAALVARPDPVPAPPLYTEVVEPRAPLYDLEYLPGVDAPNARLSDRVDDAFNALRERVRDKTGYDFLGVLSDAWRPLDAKDEGSSYHSWHKAGRAIDTRTELRTASGRSVLVVVREDKGGPWGRTYWRLYLRTARQDGSMGEPLKQAPWDFFARFLSEEAAEEGGKPLLVPAGYYVDFTALAAEYGWERIGANDQPGFSWKDDWIASDFWHFEKRHHLSWRSAMLELYDEEILNEYFWVGGPQR